MIALQLLEVKDCMQKLLLSDTFDHFSFIEGSITTFNKFTFDGYLKKEYFSDDNSEVNRNEYSMWGDVRDYCYQVIKGKRTPLQFKFVFSLSNENIAKLISRDLPHLSIEEIQGLYLNFQYEQGRLDCITGTSTKTFSMDKSLDNLWDDTAKKYLKSKQIVFEEA